MLGPPDTSARFAPHWFDRAFNLNEICVVCDVPFGTAFRWLQLTQAIGFIFGVKSGREWLFDAHELYAFRMLAAFYRAGIPVGPTQIRAVAHFAFGDDGTPRIPEGRLIQAAPEAEFVVDAVKIYHAVAEATKPEPAHA